MGLIAHGGNLYGGGSDVVANPQDSATDTLTKVGIDGDIYSVSSLELGETSSTAYRGDRGKTAYDHATESGKISQAVQSGLYKFGATAQGHIASATAVAKADLTALGVADQNDVDAIEEDIQGYKAVTGKYITVTDAAALPAESYQITLSPVQEGSGDPSPSNVRPIHGADEVGVRVCGKNLFDDNYSDYTQPLDYRICPVKLEMGKKYIITATKVGETVTGGVIGFVRDGDRYSNFSGLSVIVNTQGATGTFLPLEFLVNDAYTTPKLVVFASDEQKFNDLFENYNIQLEQSQSVTPYEPYNGHSTTITLPSTVYGGSVEMGGSGSVTMANIASYNGETINEPWISSMDKYEAGATPTTGAQVVYPLTTPTALSVTPFTVELLEGVNNIWAECKENSTVIDNAQQSLSYQPQNIVGELRQEIEAKPDSFAQLSDTSFSNLANGQIPKWNSTSGKWENANESGGGGLPAWSKIWNYKSGATFTMPTGKTDIMLVIVLDASDTRLISNVYPVEYPFSKILNTEYFDGSDTVWMEVTTANVVNVGNNTQQPTSYFDFEIWVR